MLKNRLCVRMSLNVIMNTLVDWNNACILKSVANFHRYRTAVSFLINQRV